MNTEYQIKRIKNLLFEVAKKQIVVIKDKDRIKDILFYNWLKNTNDPDEVHEEIESDLYESGVLKILEKQGLIKKEDK